MTEKITSWSFSRYSDYRLCPAKAYYKHVKKLKEPPNKAMQRGTDIHKFAEDYVKGISKKLDSSLIQLADDFKALKKQKVKYVEEQWAFRADWTETKWNDWDGCALRVKIDAAYLNTKYNALVVIDHKTGKIRDEDKVNYTEALELYSLASFKKFPSVDIVSPRLWYVDHGIVYPEEEIEFTRDDEDRLDKLWQKRTKPMLADTKFKPTPNSKCQWCFFSASKGGPCKY